MCILSGIFRFAQKQTKNKKTPAESYKSSLQVFKVFYVAWSYQLSDVECNGVGCAALLDKKKNRFIRSGTCTVCT